MHQIPMSSMQLNTIKTCLLSPLGTLLILFFTLCDIFCCHLFWNRVDHSRHISNWLSAGNSRWAHRMMSLHFVSMRHTSTVNQLYKYFPSFSVYRVHNSLPSFHLFFIVQASVARKTSPLEAPSSGLGKNESCSCSL